MTGLDPPGGGDQLAHGPAHAARDPHPAEDGHAGGQREEGALRDRGVHREERAHLDERDEDEERHDEAGLEAPEPHGRRQPSHGACQRTAPAMAPPDGAHTADVSVTEPHLFGARIVRAPGKHAHQRGSKSAARGGGAQPPSKPGRPDGGGRARVPAARGRAVAGAAGPGVRIYRTGKAKRTGLSFARSAPSG